MKTKEEQLADARLAKGKIKKILSSVIPETIDNIPVVVEIVRPIRKRKL